MRKYWVLLFFSSLFVFPKCTKDQAGPDGCFQEDVFPIFVSNCTMSGCHNSKDKRSGYDLSNYEGIMKGIKAKHPLNSEIYKTIKGNNPSMPQRPYSRLSESDVNMIKLWINMGARNTSNCRSCDTINFRYSERIKPIMNAWCVGCHNANNPGGGIDLSNYNRLVETIKTNKFIGSIKHSSGFIAMPQNGGQLSTCEINAVQNWVNSGYPNN